MERDRQAAYFADPDGARLLLCTEIGSEGRNFEFAHHLFLFDLPKVPEQLEQRIGRLDRIGQTKNINIHVPYIKNSFEEVLFRWYYEVIESFIVAPQGATRFYQENYKELHELIESPFNTEKLEGFIRYKAEQYQELCADLKKGHDLLLDLNSFNNPISQEVITNVNNFNRGNDIKSYLEEVYNAVGINFDDLNSQSYFIQPSDNMLLPSYPSLDSEGYSYTYDRDYALIRDDLKYMSWEHPLVIGTLELFTNSQIGNMTLVTHEKKLGDNIFFEFIFKLECIQGQKSDVAMYMPLTPIRVLMDAAGNDVTMKHPKKVLDSLLENVTDARDKEKAGQIPKDAFNTLLSKALALAKKRGQKYIDKASEKLQHDLNSEIFRLEQLAKVNPIVSSEQIELLKVERDDNIKKIKGSEISIDAIRLII